MTDGVDHAHINYLCRYCINCWFLVSRGSWGQRGERIILYVANNGVNSINCGARATPCRSINQAINNAVDGDQIEVGAGRYGDLNADGDFSDLGEEGTPGSDGILIKVNKRLGVFSQNGATATIIDAAFHTFNSNLIVVKIFTGGVSFGRENGGFTIIGGDHLQTAFRCWAAMSG